MVLTPLHFIIVCPLVFLAGLVDAVAGGGGLISLPAYMIAGFPAINALATNKCSSFMGTSVATAEYVRKGYVPGWHQALFCILCALAGSNVGAHIALLVPDRVFKVIMLAVLPCTALYLTRGKTFRDDKEQLPSGRVLVISMLAAFFLGMYDGFYGPGTGTFLILVLNGAANLPVRQANGLTKVINWATNLGALGVYLTNGKTILVMGLAAGLFNMAGNYVGGHMFEKGGAKIAKPIMLTVLSIFFAKVILELLGVIS